MNLPKLLLPLSLSLSLFACASELPESASTSQASYYPPDYPACHIDESQETGSFEIIRHHQNWTTGYGLTVAYRGYLREQNSDEDIWFYLKLNGQEAWVQAQSGSNGDAYARLWAGPRDCWHCSGYPGQPCDEMGWVCNWPTETEERIFEWASSGYRLNQWDVEVAATANGAWDSNYGQNFGASFDERVPCTD